MNTRLGCLPWRGGRDLVQPRISRVIGVERISRGLPVVRLLAPSPPRGSLRVTCLAIFCKPLRESPTAANPFSVMMGQA